MGHREIWSKAIAFALMNKASSENRGFAAILFDGRVREIRYAMKSHTQQERMSSMMDIVSTFTGGGTSWEAPIRCVQEILEKVGDGSATCAGALSELKELKRADVIFITDGECEVSENFGNEWREFREENELTCYGLLVGASHNWSESINTIADKTWSGVLSDDAQALDLVLGE